MLLQQSKIPDHQSKIRRAWWDQWRNYRIDAMDELERLLPRLHRHSLPSDLEQGFLVSANGDTSFVLDKLFNGSLTDLQAANLLRLLATMIHCGDSETNWNALQAFLADSRIRVRSTAVVVTISALLQSELFPHVYSFDIKRASLHPKVRMSLKMGLQKGAAEFARDFLEGRV